MVLKESYFRCSTRISDRAKKWLIILTLIFYGQAVAICCSIRYGFLADAFSRRDVPGKIYGIISGSMVIGYICIFFLGGAEALMKRFNSRNLLAAIMFGYFILALATGFAYQINHSMTVIILSFGLRIGQGILAYPAYLIPIDYINSQLCTEFDLVNGLLNMGYFSGHGLAEVFGCLLYDRFGYVVPYIFSAGIALLATIAIMYNISPSKTYLASQKILNSSDSSQTIEKAGSYKSKLSKALVFPLIATMLINANYGVLQVTVTPFLNKNFHKSISYGGAVLTFVSVGMAVGSLTAGLLLQKKILNHFTIMAVGAFCVCIGLLITFPSEALPAVYDITPIMAFPGVFLAGLGDPLITISTLRALYDIQLQRKGVLNPNTVTRITGIWLVGYCTLYYSGSFIAGLLTDFLSYSVIAEILAGVCIIAVLICVILRVLALRNKGDEEALPLISGH